MALVGAFLGALFFAQGALLASGPRGGIEIWGPELLTEVGLGSVAALLVQLAFNAIFARRPGGRAGAAGDSEAR